jgi:polysaccharide pyruvyl transferase WcaK-like protein
MFSRKKKLIYYGFLGDGNFGDELVFMATKKLFKDCVIIPYQRHMPIFTKLYCKLFKDSMYGVIIGGGTLIRGFSADKTYYKKLISMGKPIFYHGTGVDEELMDKTFWPSLLNSNHYGGVRGLQSQRLLEKLGFNFNYIGDAALCLEGKVTAVKKRKQIIVNLGTHNVMQELLYSRSQIIKFLNSDTVKDYSIAYLPLHSIDYDLGKMLKLDIPRLEILDIAESYQDTLNILAEAEFSIGERLHFVVLSVLARTNFISINYHHKHVDFLNSIDLSNLGLCPKNASYEVIKTIFTERKEVVNWFEINTKLKNLKIIQNNERDVFLDS